MIERVFGIFIKVAKNIGYIGVGCTIVGFIEYGFSIWMLIGFMLAVILIALSYCAIRQIEHTEYWTGRKFISMVLERPIKNDELDKVDEAIDKLSTEAWNMCATEEDISRVNS